MLKRLRTLLDASVWRRRIVFGSLGAVAGFSYYFFIGCYSGTCPISGNPYISTLYGAAVGLLMATGEKKQETSSNGE